MKHEKLSALLTSCEVEEQKALQEKRRIDDIVEQRRVRVEEVAARQSALEQRRLLLKEEQRLLALQAGDVGRLKAVLDFEKRLAKEAQDVTELLEKRQTELNRALERAAIAHEELIAARIEKKKVEKILSRRTDEEQAVGAAVEQALQDELSSYRHSK